MLPAEGWPGQAQVCWEQRSPCRNSLLDAQVPVEGSIGQQKPREGRFQTGGKAVPHKKCSPALVTALCDPPLV